MRGNVGLQFLTTLCLFIACSSVTFGANPVVPGNSTPAAPLFEVISARDKSFTGLVPVNWTLNGASLQYLQMTSPQRETVSVIILDVCLDAPSLQTYTQVRAMGGNPLPPSLQFYSVPLAPADVLQKIYPRAAGSAVQQLAVLNAQNVTATTPTRAGVFHYQYLFNGQVRYEGETLIITLPVTYTRSINYWTLIAMGGEAPAQLFQQNKALYAFILGSLHYNQQVLNENARLPFDRMWEKDPEYRKRMDKLISMLGVYEYEGPNGERHTLTGPLAPGETLWQCAGRIIHEPPEHHGPDCVQLKPAE